VEQLTVVTDVRYNSATDELEVETCVIEVALVTGE
jgi:hypothetical protein